MKFKVLGCFGGNVPGLGMTSFLLADVSGHLTPRTLAGELLKLKRDVPVYLYGRKPRFAAAIARQLKGLPDRRARLLVQGRTYSV